MFLTLFPTNLSPIPVKVIMIDYQNTDRLSFSHCFKERKDHYQPDTSDTLKNKEIHPTFMTFGRLGVPMTTGVLLNNEPNSGLGAVPRIAYDSEKQEYKPMIDGFVEERFAGLNYHADILDFNSLFFDVFARATGLKSIEKIATPTNIQFNFLKNGNEDGNDIIGYNPSNDSGPQRYIALLNGKWVYGNDTVITDIETSALIEGKFDTKDCLVYARLDGGFGRPNHPKFSFHKPKVNDAFYHHLNLTINVPCEETDPKVGPKLLDALGIKYDTFHDVETKDGFVEPSSLMSGTHQYAVVRTKMHIIDTERALSLYPELKQETSESKKSPFGRRYQVDPLVPAKRVVLLTNHKGEITDNILNVCINGWQVNNLLNKIVQIRRNVRDSDGSLDGELITQVGEQKSVQSEMKEVLLDLIIEVERDLPVFTPRLSEKVNATLNDLFKRNSHHMVSNSNLVYDPAAVELYEEHNYYREGNSTPISWDEGPF